MLTSVFDFSRMIVVVTDNSLTMLIASSHILSHVENLDHQDFRVTCIDLTNYLSDHLFRCLNSNHSHSLIVIKHMLFQFPKGKGDQI